MLAIAAFCLLLQSPRVTVSTAGMRVEALLREVSAQTGTTLRANSRVRGEIVTAYIDRVPLKEFMTNLSEADGADWTNIDGGYELTRSRTLERRQEKEEAARREALLRPVIDSEIARLLAPSGARSIAPLNRLLWKLIGQIGTATIARMPAATRVVWTDDPNRMQLALPQGSKAARQIFDKEMLATRANSSSLAPGDVAKVVIDGSFTTILGYEFHLYLLSPAGRILVESEARFEIPKGRPSVSVSSITDESLLDSTSLMREAQKLTGISTATHPLSRTPDLSEAIFHPERIDPLALFPSGVAHGLATHLKRSFIGVIPDAAIIDGLSSYHSALRTSDALQWFARYCDIDASQSGWLVAKPIYPVDTRNLRVDRVKMGAFYRQVAVKGVNLMELADYIASQPRRYPETISAPYGMFCAPETTNMCGSDLGPLRIYGALSAPERSALIRGTPLPFAQLSNLARREAEDWFFNGLVYSEGDGQEPGDIDPTFAFPNGVTMPCSLVAKSEVQMEVLPIYRNPQSLPMQPCLASELASEVLYSEFKDQIHGYYLGSASILNVRLVSPRFHAAGRLQENHLSQNKLLRYGDLPAAFRKAVEEAMPPANGFK